MPVGRGGGPTQGHFVLSPVSLASRDQDDGPVELNDRHLRSHGKIGDCEQSMRVMEKGTFLAPSSLYLLEMTRHRAGKRNLKNS